MQTDVYILIKTWYNNFMIDNKNKWDRRFLCIARDISTWSKDSNRKIGACAVKDRRIIATGYNGFPTGIHDSNKILNNKELKLRYTIHAELNMILNAAKNSIALDKSIVYVYGLQPCVECAKALIQSGIKRLVYHVDKPLKKNSKWNESCKLANELFNIVDIDVIESGFKINE